MRLSVSLVALLWVHGQPDVRVASAALPSWEQRKELWLRGEITDRDKKTWNVLIVPGARWIDARAERGWQDAGVVITSLVQHSFWDKREAEFMTGIRFSNDAIRGGWLNRIGDDFEETRQENESLPPGEMGSAFFPFVNWVWFGAKALARTVWMPVGALSGVTYGIGRPAISVMTTPVVEAGAYDLLARGIAVPVALYAWNGITWVALAAGNVPTRESTFVRLVHREQEVVIERQQLETLLHAAVLKRLTDDRVAELNARIQEIEAEADAKKRPLREQQLAAVKAFAQSSTATGTTSIVEEARRGGRVRLSADAAKLYFDEPRLKRLIQDSLRQSGVQAPPAELVDSICEKFAGDLRALHLDAGAEEVRP